MFNNLGNCKLKQKNSAKETSDLRTQILNTVESPNKFSSAVVTNETMLSHCKVLTSVVLVWEFDNSLVLMYYADLSYLSLIINYFWGLSIA